MEGETKKDLKDILDGFYVTCVILTLFVTFLSIGIIVEDITNSPSSTHTQIVGVVIMAIASIKIGLSLRRKG